MIHLQNPTNKVIASIDEKSVWLSENGKIFKNIPLTKFHNKEDFSTPITYDNFQNAKKYFDTINIERRKNNEKEKLYQILNLQQNSLNEIKTRFEKNGIEKNLFKFTPYYNNFEVFYHGLKIGYSNHNHIQYDTLGFFDDSYVKNIHLGLNVAQNNINYGYENNIKTKCEIYQSLKANSEDLDKAVKLREMRKQVFEGKDVELFGLSITSWSADDWYSENTMNPQDSKTILFANEQERIDFINDLSCGSDQVFDLDCLKINLQDIREDFLSKISNVEQFEEYFITKFNNFEQGVQVQVQYNKIIEFDYPSIKGDIIIAWNYEKYINYAHNFEGLNYGEHYGLIESDLYTGNKDSTFKTNLSILIKSDELEGLSPTEKFDKIIDELNSTNWKWNDFKTPNFEKKVEELLGISIEIEREIEGIQSLCKEKMPEQINQDILFDFVKNEDYPLLSYLPKEFLTKDIIIAAVLANHKNYSSNNIPTDLKIETYLTVIKDCPESINKLPSLNIGLNIIPRDNVLQLAVTGKTIVSNLELSKEKTDFHLFFKNGKIIVKIPTQKQLQEQKKSRKI